MHTVILDDIKLIHIGVMQSLVQEYEHQRCPRLFRLKDKIDRGEVINDIDLEYICKQLKDASLAMHLTVNYPELRDFCFIMGHLCKDICDGALENQTHSL